MIEVEGHVKGNSIIYKCQFCKGEHTHGYIKGETKTHRWSHCAKGDESVLIHIIS